MARTLPQSLINSIKSFGQQPALSLVMQNPSAPFSLVGSRSTNGRTDLKATSSGALLRATCVQGSTPAQIIVDRITDVTSAAQWQAAGAVVATDARPATGCAIGISGSQIRVFYQSNTDLKVYYVESNDDGQSWSGETATNGATPYSSGNYGYGIAAVTATQVWLAWSTYDPNGNSAISTMSYASFSWSTWSIVGPSLPPYGKIRGLQADTGPSNDLFTGGVQFIPGVSGIAAGLFTFSSPGSYTNWTQLRNQDNPNLGVSLANPTIHYSNGTYYLAIMNADNGSNSGQTNNRTELLTSASPQGPWFPVAVLSRLVYNAHFFPSGGYYYALDGAACYRQLATTSYGDVSADLLALQVTEGLDTPVTAVITLANHQGQWNNHPSIRVDAQITLSLGYGSDLVQTHSFLLDTYEYTSTPTQHTLILHCQGPDKLLDYVTPTTYTYTSQSIATLITNVCSHAGMPLAALPGAVQFSHTVPSFALTAGESYRTALHRLAAIYGFTYHTNTAGQLVITEPSQSDPTTWDYAQEILGSTYAFSADQPNHIRVVGYARGQTVSADIVDAANYDLVGRERYAQVADRMIDSDYKAQTAASLILANAQRHAVSAAITCGLNPTHEPGDILTLTDPAIGLAKTSLRVNTIHWIIQPETATWLNQLTLTAP